MTVYFLGGFSGEMITTHADRDIDTDNLLKA